MGGVGGSVTIMSYGYWIREAGWKGSGMLKTMRWDLGVSYALTALFAVCVVILGAGVRPEVIQGNGMAVAFAEQLVPYTGQAGKWLFLLGFWGAVWSSMLGVWHGVPYLFANFVAHYRKRGQTTFAADAIPHTENGEGKSGLSPFEVKRPFARTPAYRGFLLYMALVPMLLLVTRAPVQVVRLYTIAGAMFMPLLAVLLLYLNRPKWLGEHANGRLMQVCLALCLALFVYLLFTAPSA
jgi:Mn2+/Fe2+ NRAMP family transporter